MCSSCGAPRAAGRFNPAPGRERVFRAKPAYRAPDTGVTGRKKRRSLLAFFTRAVGWLLTVLLPGFVIAFAITQYEALSGALTPLLLGNDAPDWLRFGLYGLMTLTAALLSILPGLWTVMLGRGAE